MSTRRHFLRGLALGVAALYLRLRPEAVAEVTAVTVDSPLVLSLVWMVKAEGEWREVSGQWSVEAPAGLGWEDIKLAVRWERQDTHASWCNLTLDGQSAWDAQSLRK